MKIKLIESKIYDNVRVTTYQSINTGRTWTIYQTIESIVIPIREVTVDTVWDAIAKELNKGE